MNSLLGVIQWKVIKEEQLWFKEQDGSPQLYFLDFVSWRT